MRKVTQPILHLRFIAGLGVVLVTIFGAWPAAAQSAGATERTAEDRQAAKHLAAKRLPRYEAMFLGNDDGEVAIDKKATLIRAMSDRSAIEMVQAAAAWLPDPKPVQALKIVRTFRVISNRPSFDQEAAKVMLSVLDEFPAQSSVAGRLSSLQLRLHGQAGSLTQEMIDVELKQITDTAVSSALRLGVLGALTDAMWAASLKPSAEVLEHLLTSDVYEIRMHAVDWFRIAPPTDMPDRERFLKSALRMNPYQVRERAYRALQSWPQADVDAVKSALPENCQSESNPSVRTLCNQVRMQFSAK